MSKIMLKTTERKTSVSRSAVREAIADAYEEGYKIARSSSSGKFISGKAAKSISKRAKG